MDISPLTIPDNSLAITNISNLNTSLNSLSGYIGTLNTNVSNLSANIANLNTSVSDLGNIETIARAWAESSSPPDPNNSSSKSSKIGREKQHNLKTKPMNGHRVMGFPVDLER